MLDQNTIHLRGQKRRVEWSRRWGNCVCIEWVSQKATHLILKTVPLMKIDLVREIATLSGW